MLFRATCLPWLVLLAAAALHQLTLLPLSPLFLHRRPPCCTSSRFFSLPVPVLSTRLHQGSQASSRCPPRTSRTSLLPSSRSSSFHSQQRHSFPLCSTICKPLGTDHHLLKLPAALAVTPRLRVTAGRAWAQPCSHRAAWFSELFPCTACGHLVRTLPRYSPVGIHHRQPLARVHRPSIAVGQILPARCMCSLCIKNESQLKKG